MNPKLLARLVSFRRELHTFPETSMKEFQTQKRVIDILKEFGVKEQAITKLNPTALVVDLKGQAAPSGKNICVAFRADMDALSMVEQNQHLEYKSQNHGSAHMCGHDGHMTCLLGFVPLYLQQLQKIPNNKTIRLLFQPSEQGPASGAKLMIEQGCLNGVDQVYGFHNWPIGKFGDIWCKQGPVMSQITAISIKIIGTGGHGSEPDRVKFALLKAVQFYQTFRKYLAELKSTTGKFFVCTIPVFQAGQRFNVISQSVKMEGSLRTFDQDIRDAVINKIYELLEQIKKQGFSYEFNPHYSTVTANSKAESDNVLRVARSFLGQDKVGSGSLPFLASEDFGYYTKQKPGAFFFFCTKQNEDDVFLHNPRFNFKDDIIETAAQFWLKLAMDRVSSE